MSYKFPNDNADDDKNKRGGRPSSFADMSPQAAHAEAKRLLSQGLSEHAWHVIELLAQSGVLSTEQLGFLVAPSTLVRKYAPKRIVDKLPFMHGEIAAACQALGLQRSEDTRLYVLGPVGVELATLRSGKTPVTGHLAYTLTRVMHDVALNEVILRIYRFADQRGWRVDWAGTNEGALYNADFTRKVLEPDALLTLHKNGETPRHFCVEYHNEDKRTRAEGKIDRYEAARVNNEKLWQAQWKTDTFPAVLAVFAKRIVGVGYRDKLTEIPAEVQFYGKLLEGVLDDNLAEWVNFTVGKRETIFA